MSGRAGFELVQKAVAAGVGALVAVGAPSSLAVRLAQESGLELYGFISPKRCVRYTANDTPGHLCLLPICATVEGY